MPYITKIILDFDYGTSIHDAAIFSSFISNRYECDTEFEFNDNIYIAYKELSEVDNVNNIKIAWNKYINGDDVSSFKNPA